MKSLQMLLRVVLALAILLQGSFGVGSAYAEARSGHHGHASPTAEGHPAKCPCCPKSSDVDCASFCALVALPALDAHTRLLFGRSLAYQVTEKRV